jgi:predicted phosphodiesterase
MRIVAISDTHGRHDVLNLPPGDVLVHAGDFTGRGTPWEIIEFARWLHARPFAHRVVVAGNHDRLFESDPGLAQSLLREHCPGVVYLQDDGAVVGGLTFWGSPWQPRFMDWAFNLERGPELARVWARVPDGVDVLVTHGPPQGVLDRTRHGLNVGCEELAAALVRIAPKVHIFGHIHAGSGEQKQAGVHFVNACILDALYQPTNPPRVIEL